jgi:SAM-dependent methyltransferase
MTGPKEDVSNSLFDPLAAEYDAWFEEEEGKLIFNIETIAFRDALTLLPKPWLEVGVGSGRFAQALGIETGIDPSVKLLEIAKKRGINVFPGKGEELPFPDSSFGTAFLIVTLCFLNTPLVALREAHRILKADGKLVLGVVLRESPWGRFYMAKKEAGHRFYSHATIYSYQEIESLLSDSGFRTEKVISTLFQQPGDVKETENPKDGYSSVAGFTVIVAGH